MGTFTREDYKIAIRDRYRIAITEDATGVLSNPTPGELRDFYFRIFEKGLSKTDKEIMDVFFGAKENIPLRMAIEGFNTGKLKSIILFFEGGNTNNKSRIEMMAILVDFRPRPFSKFQENKGVIEKNDILEEKENSIIEGKNNNKTDERTSKTELVTDQNRADKNPGHEKQQHHKYKFFEKLLKRSKLTIVIVAVIFGFTATTIYFAFFNKGCMQWSDDHYELVYCDKPIKGNLNDVIQIDDNLLSLKKIPVCDSSRCFKPDGEAIVYYTKNNKKVDFFNSYGNGKHPENKSTMRPISDHIFRRYKKKDCTSK